MPTLSLSPEFHKRCCPAPLLGMEYSVCARSPVPKHVDRSPRVETHLALVTDFTLATTLTFSPGPISYFSLFGHLHPGFLQMGFFILSLFSPHFLTFFLMSVLKSSPPFSIRSLIPCWSGNTLTLMEAAGQGQTTFRNSAGSQALEWDKHLPKHKPGSSKRHKEEPRKQ